MSYFVKVRWWCNRTDDVREDYFAMTNTTLAKVGQIIEHRYEGHILDVQCHSITEPVIDMPKSVYNMLRMGEWE